MTFLSKIGNSIYEIPHTPTAAVTGGDVVVVGEIVGLAPNDIEASRLGSLSVSGRAEIAKSETEAIAAGAQLYWDATSKVATATAGSNKKIGKAISAAATTDAYVDVLYGMGN